MNDHTSEIIKDLIEAVKDFEIAENYYDTWGLSLHIAILKNNVIALSSKHWAKNYYIEVKNDEDTTATATVASDKLNKSVFGLWDIIIRTSSQVSRELDRDDLHYVYIPNLNRDQTCKVYEEILTQLRSQKGCSFDVVPKWELYGWNVTIDNTVSPPWLKYCLTLNKVKSEAINDALTTL
jgi:hypothetical protein